MKRFLLLILILGLSGLLVAQDWQVVKEGDMELKPVDGFFIDATTGWYVGEDGLVVKTSNGGESGETMREPDESGVDWKAVEFTNANVGYACANDGFIYKSVDAGVTWVNVGDTSQFTDDLKEIAVVDENTVYVCGNDSTLLKTVDGGTSWTRSTDSFNGEDLDGGIAFTDADHGVVISDGNGGNTWYTEDGGATWNHVALIFPPALSSSRTYAVSAGGTSTFVVVGYHYAKFVSTDGGKTYTNTGDVTYGYERHQCVEVLDANTVVASGTDGHVELSTDGGMNWTSIDLPSARNTQFVDFMDSNTGYVFSADGQWFKTTDGGTNWTPLRDWPNISLFGIALPEDDKIVLTATTGGEITMSTDGGATWLYPSNLVSGSIENLYECEFIDADNGLIGGGYGELRRTTDGGASWTFIDNPMYQNTNKHINSIHYLDATTALAGGSSGIIMKTVDGGLTWVELEKGGTSTTYDIWPINANQVIATAASGKIYLSNAAVDTFTQVNDYGSMSMRAAEFRGDVGLVAASSGHMYRTTVADWDTLIEVFTEPAGEDFYDVEFITDMLVYAVGEHGIIYKSEDAGLTWAAEMSPTDQTLQKVRLRNNRLWAVGQGGTIIMLDLTPPTPVTGLVINEFMASNDGSFLDEFEGADDWIEIYNTNDFAVDVGGLFVTDDLEDPTTWQIPTTAPDTTTIPAGGFLILWADKESEQGVLHVEIKLSGDGEQIGLVEDFMGDTLFVDSLTFGAQQADTSYGYVTDGSGEWALFNPASPGASNSTGTMVGIIEKPDHTITEYSLAQNYPNPFNPTTTINFAIRKSGKTSLTVYSLTGQKVATLLNKEIQAGNVAVTWDATNVATGVYFYKLTSGDFVSVKKMLLVK